MSPLLKKIVFEYLNNFNDEYLDFEKLLNSNEELEDTELFISYKSLIEKAVHHYFNNVTNLSLRERIYFDNLQGYSTIKDLSNKKETLNEKSANLEEFNSAFDKINNSEKLSIDLVNNELFYVLFTNYNASTIKEWEKQLQQISLEVQKIHSDERENEILKGHIYKIDSDDELIVIGDIHGDIFSLWQILVSEGLFNLNNKKIVFLGDYIDRGNYQLSTLFLPLLLKKAYPENVYLLKGNHENFILDEEGFYKPNVSGDDDLFLKFWSNYLSKECLDSIVSVLNDLPVLIQVNDIIGIVHGGLPRPTNGERYDEINSLFDLDTEARNYEMIWNRPVDKEIAVIITGDSDFETSLPHFNNFTEKVGWKFMIRGHCIDLKGYKLFYNNRMATIFSSGSFMAYPGYQSYRPVYASIKDNVFFIKKVYGNDVLETIDLEEL